jgi:hypothetical protein
MQASPCGQDLRCVTLHPFAFNRFPDMLLSPLGFPARSAGCPRRPSCPQPPAPVELSNKRRSGAPDIWIAVNNARQLYGLDDVISFERALEWRDINPDISMSVKQGKLLAGMVTYLPLEEQVILALLRDDMRERNIPDQAIRQWMDPQISVYIAGIAIVKTEEEDKQVDSLRGRFLLRNAIKWAITLTTQYDIKNWYSIGVTSEGQAIAEALGFQEIMSLEDGKRKSYVLDSILTQPTKLVRRYLRNMEGQI